MRLVVFCCIVPFFATAVMMLGIWALEWAGIINVPPDLEIIIAVILFLVWSFVAYDGWRRYR